MTPEITRTLLIDAAIVAILVVLAFVLAPGIAVIGIAALIVLILGGISFLVGNLRSRRRRKRREARRQAVAAQSRYGSVRADGPGAGSRAAGRPEGPAVRRVPASRRAQTQRRPPR